MVPLGDCGPEAMQNSSESTGILLFGVNVDMRGKYLGFEILGRARAAAAEQNRCKRLVTALKAGVGPSWAFSMPLRFGKTHFEFLVVGLDQKMVTKRPYN
jgi:hypothetical protein